MPAPLNQEIFVARAISVHGSFYSYELAEFRKTSAKLLVTCGLHGPFPISPSNLFAGKGCPSCARTKRAQSLQMTHEEFMERVRAVHGDKYGYDKALYVRANERIPIHCHKHGYFLALAGNLFKGGGCPTCGKKQSGISQRLTTSKFVAMSAEVHEDRYDYSLVTYVTAKVKVTILCRLHGAFAMLPYAHVRGSGCPKCGLLQQVASRTLDINEFLARAVAEHGTGTYDYSAVSYVRSGDKVDITCPTHGVFSQTPENHLYLQAGCPSCCHRYSDPHKEVEGFLSDQGLSFTSNDRKAIPPKEVDMLLSDFRLAIEFNGVYWHSLTGVEPSTAKQKHLDKFQACQRSGIRLLQIDEYEWRDPVKQEIWKSIILSKVGKHQRLPARKTTFRVVSGNEAREFLAKNHLQGSTPGTRWCYGLEYEGALVGIATFAEHEKQFINLTRMAFPLGVTVVGGARKLWKNALALLPKKDIVTFSNNQYSAGDIYKTLGFEQCGELPPSYQWFYRNKVWNKRSLRRKYLPGVLGDGFNPQETEHQNLYRNKARCLYDAGYKRWLYRRVPYDLTTATLSEEQGPHASTTPQESA